MADESVGTDEAREAKIEDTLRKMGVQGIEENRAKAKENSKSMGDQITSIFDVSRTQTAALASQAHTPTMMFRRFQTHTDDNICTGMCCDQSMTARSCFSSLVLSSISW